VSKHTLNDLQTATQTHHCTGCLLYRLRAVFYTHTGDSRLTIVHSLKHKNIQSTRCFLLYIYYNRDWNSIPPRPARLIIYTLEAVCQPLSLYQPATCRRFSSCGRTWFSIWDCGELAALIYLVMKLFECFARWKKGSVRTMTNHLKSQE